MSIKVVYFKKGFIDAICEEEPYQQVGINKDNFSISDKDGLLYESDLPDISKCESFEDVVIEFELKGWKLIQK